MVNIVINRWHRFLVALDSELVSLYQNLFYFFLVAMGIYNLFFADAQPSSVQDAITGHFYHLWLWLLIIFCPLCILGKKLKGDFTLLGMQLQLVGDVGAWGAVGAATLASILTTSWGHDGTAVVFFESPTYVALGLLVFRDVRRLIRVERQVRR